MDHEFPQCLTPNSLDPFLPPLSSRDAPDSSTKRTKTTNDKGCFFAACVGRKSFIHQSCFC